MSAGKLIHELVRTKYVTWSLIPTQARNTEKPSLGGEVTCDVQA